MPRVPAKAKPKRRYGHYPRAAYNSGDDLSFLDVAAALAAGRALPVPAAAAPRPAPASAVPAPFVAAPRPAPARPALQLVVPPRPAAAPAVAPAPAPAPAPALAPVPAGDACRNCAATMGGMAETLKVMQTMIDTAAEHAAAAEALRNQLANANADKARVQAEGTARAQQLQQELAVANTRFAADLAGRDKIIASMRRELVTATTRLGDVEGRLAVLQTVKEDSTTASALDKLRASMSADQIILHLASRNKTLSTEIAAVRQETSRLLVHVDQKEKELQASKQKNSELSRSLINLQVTVDELTRRGRAALSTAIPSPAEPKRRRLAHNTEADEDLVMAAEPPKPAAPAEPALPVTALAVCTHIASAPAPLYRPLKPVKPFGGN